MTEGTNRGEGNPAAELFEIFSAWATAGGGSNHKRRDMDGEGLSQHVRAMNLVQETIRAIDALAASGRNVRIYRSSQDAWISAVVVLGSDNWRSGTSASHDFTPVMMNALEGLADVIEHTSGANTAEAAIIGILLDQVADAARDTDIDPRLSAHIMKVVNRLREYLHDFDNVSPEAANDAWEAAWAAASAAAAQTTGEDRTRWEKLRDSFFVPTATGLLASAPSLALQITQIAAGGVS